MEASIPGRLSSYSEVTQHEIHSLHTRLSDSHVIDGSAITQFTNILLDANTKCRTVCTSSSKSKFTKTTDAPWYDSDCKELGKKFITTRNEHKKTDNKEPNNTNHQYPITHVELLDRKNTTQEVDYVITHLKPNKSPGADYVLNECLIFGKGNLIHLITLIFNILYNTSTFLKQWSEGIVIPI